MKLPHRSKRRQQTMFECIRSFLVLHFVLSLYRQLITKSLIHYITQRYLTQSPKVFLQGNNVWLMSLCLKAGGLRHNASLSTAFQRGISGKRYRTFHRISRISFSNCSIASCRLGTCASVQKNCWPNSGRDSVSTQCVSTSGVRGFSSRRKITP